MNLPFIVWPIRLSFTFTARHLFGQQQRNKNLWDLRILICIWEKFSAGQTECRTTRISKWVSFHFNFHLAVLLLNCLLCSRSSTVKRVYSFRLPTCSRLSVCLSLYILYMHMSLYIFNSFRASIKALHWSTALQLLYNGRAWVGCVCPICIHFTVVAKCVNISGLEVIRGNCWICLLHYLWHRLQFLTRLWTLEKLRKNQNLPWRPLREADAAKDTGKDKDKTKKLKKVKFLPWQIKNANAATPWNGQLGLKHNQKQKIKANWEWLRQR